MPIAMKFLERSPQWLQRLAHRTAAGEGRLGRLVDAVRFGITSEKAPPLPPVPDVPIRLVIGPTNSAGQGFQWARAVERFLPATAATAMMGTRSRAFKPDVDVQAPTLDRPRLAAWHADFEEFLAQHTHVLWESGRPLLGRRYDLSVRREISRLQERQVQGALLFHGSDIRLPSRHAETNPWSPIPTETTLGHALQENAANNAMLAAEVDVPVYVSTPDLLQWLPGATWCPVVVDAARWRAAVSSRVAGQVPVVVHAPSQKWLKGTELIEPILRRLAAEGLIEYRQIIDVPHAAMPEFYAAADIVLDQFVLGIYGVAACEAMATGRLVLSHVDEYTRRQVRERTGLELPIHETTIATLETEIRRAVAEPEEFDSLRVAGPAFVEAVHDGRRSAAALAAFLGVTS